MPKSRILVIDDEAAIRDSLKMTLEYEGYECIGAATGQEGLALVEREAPALRPRHDQHGGRSDEERGVRFHREAVRERTRARQPAERAGAAPAPRRESDA